MPTTTKGLPYPSDFDQPAVPSDIGALALAIDPLLTPTATIVATARATAPDGWLLCDGANVSRSTYANLFSAIGTAFGAGDGSTTFSLPNFKGRIPLGRDDAQTEFDTLGETGGSKTHTHTNPASGISGAHTHQINPPLTGSSSDGHAHTAPSHTHTGPSHSHTGPIHNHSVAIGEGTTSSAGAHTHTDTTSGPSSTSSILAGSGSQASFASTSHTHSVGTTTNGNHTHTFNPDNVFSEFSGDSVGTTSQNAATGLSGTGSTGGPAYAVTSATSTEAHSHTTDIAEFTSGAESTTHSHTVGTSDASSSLPPYVVINYIIKS